MFQSHLYGIAIAINLKNTELEIAQIVEATGLNKEDTEKLQLLTGDSDYGNSQKRNENCHYLTIPCYIPKTNLQSNY